eukprot:TRINITY_DN18337_c0_g1_i1.p1 TRINITY_DN18337_c0_g1~~TRINITY_DN18337_c0_g1_i1.p1  ORF type:complete len:450 (+),score=133.90 TRINITY_DN18337_c0_g1_i1:80-1429(+)
MLTRVPGRCLTRQLRTAIGEGGPGLMWKKTVLAERHRREGPVKRRVQQMQYGKKMQREHDLSFRPLADAGGGSESPGTPRSQGRKGGLVPAAALKKMYRTNHERDMPDRYLVESNIGDRIMNTIGKVGLLANKTVVIVGCGMGVLAQAAVAAGAKLVVGIEKDERWMRPYAEFAKQNFGKFRFEIGDALEVDLADLLVKFGVPPPTSWGSESDVVVLSALGPAIEHAFFLKMLVDLSQRTGAYAYGGVHYYSIVPKHRALALASDPNHPEFSELSLQRMGLFNAVIEIPVKSSGYFGNPRADFPDDTLLLLTPKATPTTLPPGEIIHASEILSPRKKKSKAHGRNREAAAPQQTALFDILARSMPDGRARSILDRANLDGGVSMQHLAPADAVSLLEAVAAIHPADGNARPRRARPLQKVRHGKHTLEGREFDPLLDTFLEKQPTAARW